MSEIPIRLRCSSLCSVHCGGAGNVRRAQERRLLEEALFLCQNGEYAPGGTENWGDWVLKAERFLRGEQ